MQNNNASNSLDPKDWSHARKQAHIWLDHAVDHIEGLAQQASPTKVVGQERPVWRRRPADWPLRESTLPKGPQTLESILDEYLQQIEPYTLHNSHPGFMGWVQGGGTFAGMLAELMAGSLNANAGGRDHAPVEIEKRIVEWMRELFHFPESASGLFLTGSSMANFLAILIARNECLERTNRSTGLLASGKQLTAYVSQSAHRCVAQGMDMAGIGSKWLRKISVDDQHRIQIDELRAAIEEDLRIGLGPSAIVGCAGTVDIGAIDNLRELSRIAQEYGLWFHIDGAFGALGMMSSTVAKKLDGIELADSIAFDFHKWGQVPYDAGFLLVRDGKKQLASFENPADYLSRDERAMSAGHPWPCDLGPDLSRGFRALKTWVTLKAYGTEGIGGVIDGSCELAKDLAKRIEEHPELELLSPVPLNIVCFRYRCEDSDKVNSDIVAAIQNEGQIAPSSTSIHGQFAIRAALFNHRTTQNEVELLVEQVVRFGRELTGCIKQAPTSFQHESDMYMPIPSGLTKLMRHAFSGGDLSPVAQEHWNALQEDPNDAFAMMDLNIVFQLAGEPHNALPFMKQALQLQQVYRLQETWGNPLKLLVILTEGVIMDNMPIEFLVEHAPVQLDALYLGEGIPAPSEIPEHDLAIIGVCESDAKRPLLQGLQEVVERWPRPVLNHPRSIMQLSRETIGDVVAGIPNLQFARSVRLKRSQLTTSWQGNVDHLPSRFKENNGWIIRPVDSHAGQGLERFFTEDDLQNYLAKADQEEFFIAPFVDYQGVDGCYRKYRIALVDGQAFPVHMAISQRWMVHYLNADMLDNEHHRKEEEAFLSHFDDGFGDRHRGALASLYTRLGLDYVVIDCAETTDGDFLLFEADNGAVVHSMDPVDVFPYKLPAMERIFQAFHEMLFARTQVKSKRRAA